MNILIFKFPYSSQFGGGEKHTLVLLERLRKRGYQFFLVSSCGVLREEFKKKDWPVKNLWAGPEPVAKWSALLFLFLWPVIFVELFIVLLYYKLFKKVKILYCLSLTEKIITTPLARIMGIKVVWLEHTLIGKWLSVNPWRLFYILWSPAARIVAVSYAVARQIRALGVPAKSIQVIYNGIDVQKCPLAPSVKNYRKYFTVGAVCRLHREKGVEYLLKAIKTAQEFIPNLRAVIIGDGPERQNLLWLARQLEIYEQVLFLGFQKKIEHWLKDFDIFILPSVKKEALGLVSLEVMACGKSVIATRVGGIPEVVSDGLNGILVEPANSQMIAEAIINLHRHPERRREMGIIGRRIVEKKFSLEKMIDEYEELFQELIS